MGVGKFWYRRQEATVVLVDTLPINGGPEKEALVLSTQRACSFNRALLCNFHHNNPVQHLRSRQLLHLSVDEPPRCE
jgi:hypothetical protein